MLRRTAIITFLSVFLSACNSSPITTGSGGSPLAVTAEASLSIPTTTLTAVPTQIPTAVPEPTLSTAIEPTEIRVQNTQPVPLTVEGLSPLLFQKNDIIGNWAGDEIYDESPVDYTGPTPAIVLNQGLVEDGSKFPSGNVILWVFNNQEDASTAYKSRTELIERTVDKDVAFQRLSIGDAAFLAPGKGTVFVVNQLVFSRCKAVVEIRVGTNSEVEQTINYAANLDKRVQSTVCN